VVGYSERRGIIGVKRTDANAFRVREEISMRPKRRRFDYMKRDLRICFRNGYNVEGGDEVELNDTMNLNYEMVWR